MKLEVHQTFRSTEDSLTVLFKKPNGSFPDYKPGQHGNFLFTIDGQEFKRTYSFHTMPGVDDYPGITIRTIANGAVSQRVVKLGIESVLLEGITGEFYIESSSESRRHLIMFAGGSGITPLISMLKSVLYFEPGSSISLIYSNQSHDRIIFRRELVEFQQQFPDRFKLFNVITREQHLPEDLPVFFKGRLPKLVVKKLLKAIAAESQPNIEYYLCGPVEFTKTIEQAIRSVHTESAKVFSEHFFVPDNDAGFDFMLLPSRIVILKTTGEEKSIIVDGGKSILQAAFDNGIKLPHSCTEGHCGTCRATLLTGEVKLRKNHALTEEEVKEGQILLCQGFPLTDGVSIKTRL